MTTAARTKTASILLVDDNREFLTGLARLLGQEGYAVTEAVSGPEALARLAEAPVSLVITDQLMPGMDGFAFIRALRAAGHRVPVIILTAFGDWGPYAEALSLGVSDYLTKPVTREDLLGAIARALNSSSR